MATDFVHDTLGQRVRFGTGQSSANLKAELESYAGANVLLIAADAERELAEAVTAGIEIASTISDVAQHVPIARAERAREAAAAANIGVIVSVGGGSTTGLAKAIALTTGIPIIAIPTTYAGSEATNVWGLTEDAAKTTGVDNRVLPATVIYDAELSMTLPLGMSVASGLNAMAHCIDSQWGPRVDPINAALGAEGARALASGLRRIVADPTDLEGRENTLYGTYLSAVAFASAGSGMHHKICHLLGGRYDMPHAQTHAIVLPYVTAFNAPAAPAANDRIAFALNGTSALAGLESLRDDLDAPRALKDFGFDEANVAEAAELILPTIPASNPRPVTTADLERILGAAWAGTPASEL